MQVIILEGSGAGIILNPNAILGTLFDVAMLNGGIGIGALNPDTGLGIFDITLIEGATTPIVVKFDPFPVAPGRSSRSRGKFDVLGRGTIRS